MKSISRFRIVGLLATSLVFPAAWLASERLTINSHAGGNQNSAAPPAQTAVPFDQAQALADLRKAIAGQEDKPAGEVFKNIQMFKAMPAARLLRVMELGYAKSLGVNCTHCHVAGQWEKEDKPTKQIARDMAAMAANINNEQLKKIKNLKSKEPVINCTTCHRGQIKPALNLPG